MTEPAEKGGTKTETKVKTDIEEFTDEKGIHCYNKYTRLVN